jgi:hypothetical protein
LGNGGEDKLRRPDVDVGQQERKKGKRRCENKNFKAKGMLKHVANNSVKLYL